jgi:hypothetical protein
VLSWLYHDFAMDGVALVGDDVERALAFSEPRHHCDGQRLMSIRRTFDAIRWAQRFASENDAPLSLEDLKCFHEAVCGPGAPVGGRYRKTDSPVLPYVHPIAKHASISYYLRRLVQAMADERADWHPVRAAAHAHHDFMAAWPFDDRTPVAGRLLLNYLLLRGGYPPAVIHARSRHAYFQALSGRPEAMIPIVRSAITMTLEGVESLLSSRAA